MSRHRHVGRLVKSEMEEYDDEDDYYEEDEHDTSASSSGHHAPYVYNRNNQQQHSAAHFTSKPAKAKPAAAKPTTAKPTAALPPPHPIHTSAATGATAAHSRTSSIPPGFNAGDYADDDYIPADDEHEQWEEGQEEEWEEEGDGEHDEYDSAVTYRQPAPAAPKPKQAAKATPVKGKPATASSTPARTPSPLTSTITPPKPTATLSPGGRLRTAAEEAETVAAVNALRLEKLRLSNSPSMPRLTSAAAQGEPSLIRSYSPAPSTPTSASASSSALPSSSPGIPILRTSSSTEQLALVAQHKRQQSRLALVEAEDKKESSKPTLNVVVIGHVDAGKSTLMGHLLLLMGVVSAKTLHKYEKDSRALGKASFHFAWVMDQQDEERQRGITVDVAVSHFTTPTKHITLLDAPGHRDFIPNMIAGTAQADVAVLVVPAVVGEFEAGFVDEGQIREHALLARSMGVGQLVVAVNKCDVVEWKEERYRQILSQLLPFLKSTGYKDVTPVPVSGLTGENITACSDVRLKSWYSGPTLLAAIDSLTPPKRPIDRPFRCCVTEVFRSQSLGVTVAGRVDSGAVMKGDSVLVLPQGETVSVRGVEVNGEGVAVGRVGENVEIGLKDLTDPALLIPGSWLCDPHSPIPLTQRFRAQILTTALSRVLMSGTACIMYSQSAVEEVTVSQLVSVLDSRDGRVTQSRPRFLGRAVTAVVEVTCKRQVCIELYKDYRELGRFSLRRGTETVAVGIVQEIL